MKKHLLSRPRQVILFYLTYFTRTESLALNTHPLKRMLFNSYKNCSTKNNFLNIYKKQKPDKSGLIL